MASYSSIAMHWLPEVIQQFRRVHPDLTVDIQMGSVEEVYRWVREDKTDVGFASPPGRHDHGLGPPGGGPAAGHSAAGIRPAGP